MLKWFAEKELFGQSELKMGGNIKVVLTAICNCF